MAKFIPYYSNFTAGELSPRLHGRVDVARYYNAAKSVRDWFILQQGGVTKRPGTVWVSEAKDHTRKARLISFEFNVEQAYIIEFGHQYIRFYRDRGVIVEASPATITDITQAPNGVVTTSGSHGFSNGDQIILTGIVGMVELNNRRVTISGVAATTFETNVDTAGFAAYVSGGAASKPVEISSPYQESELFELQFAQSADVMWITHPSHKPRKLSRTSHTAWSLASYAPTADPFTSANNYPACVTFFEQRIVFASTNNAPATIWFSKSGNFEDLTAGTGADDGFSVALASGRVNRIRWILGGRQLQVGTAGDEYTETTAVDDPLTPSSIDIHPQTNYGSAPLQPIVAQNRTLFVQRSARRIREFSFVFADEAFVAPDVTILSEHLFGHADGGLAADNTSKQIVQLASAREPIPLILVVTEDGKLQAMTYERDQEIIAWSTCFPDSGTDVESVAVVPGGGGDEIWVSVKRTLNGSTRRYIEYLHRGWVDIEDAHYVDSGLIYDGAEVSVVTGLSHLEGESVTVLADGSVQPDKTVTDGAITLDEPASVVHVGLNTVQALLETLPVASQGQGALGQQVGWGGLRVLLHNTVGILINGETITFRTAADELDQPVPLFSGAKMLGDLGWDSDQDGTIRIESVQPLPATIIAVSGRAEVSDD